jgi:hypothetical protein
MEEGGRSWIWRFARRSVGMGTGSKVVGGRSCGRDAGTVGRGSTEVDTLERVSRLLEGDDDGGIPPPVPADPSIIPDTLSNPALDPPLIPPPTLYPYRVHHPLDPISFLPIHF